MSNVVVHFDVPGKPQPKQRPRFSRVSGTVYTPTQTHKYENVVRNAYRASRAGIISESHGIHAIIKCYYPIPKSTPKKIREMMTAGKLRPINRRSGDVDNIAKSILDALNGVAYADDSQIVNLFVEKWYVTEFGAEPFVDVTLSGWSE